MEVYMEENTVLVTWAGWLKLYPATAVLHGEVCCESNAEGHTELWKWDFRVLFSIRCWVEEKGDWETAVLFPASIQSSHRDPPAEWLGESRMAQNPGEHGEHPSFCWVGDSRDSVHAAKLTRGRLPVRLKDEKWKKDKEASWKCAHWWDWEEQEEVKQTVEGSISRCRWWEAE